VEKLVYSATPDGRYVKIVTYLEGGTRPVRDSLLCNSTEQSVEIARVLSEAKGVE